MTSTRFCDIIQVGEQATAAYASTVGREYFMYKIPQQYKELRRHVIQRDVRKIVGFVLWMLFFFGNAVLYNANHQTYSESRRLVGWKLLIFLGIAALLGFFLFRMWTFFTDRTYSGTVRRAGLSHSYSPPDEPYAIKSANYDFRTNTRLEVILENKKRRRVRFEQKNGCYWYYNEGEEIVHFHGLPYPINLDPTAPHGYICLACGRMHKEYQPKCDFCLLELVDPAKVSKEQPKIDMTRYKKK